MPESERALAVARELAGRCGGSVHPLWVVTLEDVHVRAMLPADWPEETYALVEEVQERLDQIDGVDGKAIYGGPREELCGLSQNSDLLIVGSRGYGPLGSLLHGSVSSYLDTLAVARTAGYRCVISHRSGETEDTFVADSLLPSA